MVILAASGNLIGGTMTGEGNVISGNSSRGVDILGVGGLPANDNLVEGNFIGTDVTGGAALPNGTASSSTGGTRWAARLPVRVT